MRTAYRLEGYTMTEIDQEKQKRERLKEIKDLIERPIVGHAVDSTGDLFDHGKSDAPLFAVKTPKF